MKKLCAFIVCCLLVLPCWGMDSIMGGFSASKAPYASATYYSPLQGVRWDSSAYKSEQSISSAGTLGSLNIELSGDSGGVLTFRYYVNGVVQDGANDPVVVISSPDTSGSDTTHTVSVSAGDLVALQCVADGDVSSQVYTRTTMVFSSTTAKESNLMGGSTSGISNSTTEYGMLWGMTGWDSSIGVWGYTVISCDATLKKLYVTLNGSPGTSKSYTFTLYVNGNPTTLTCTISDGDTTGSDVSHTVDVQPGDYVYLEAVPSGTPTSRYAHYSVTFEADTDGESLLSQATVSDFNGSSSRAELIPPR